MRKTAHRALAWVLLLLLIGAYVLIPSPASAAGRDIQDGVTLHCWNWSFKNIEANMSKIAGLGYTAIQTSPVQQAKQTTAGYPANDWWVYYQPASFSIDNTGKSALGNKAEFKSMCAAAHKYGIKVIVDVVANHMADNGSNKKSSAIIDDIEKDSSCWHDISKNTYDYSKRYDVTQWCLDGLPDLNTANKKVQNYVLNFLKECIDAGADGFRFDAAKHIETPDDGADNCASDFWPTVVNGAESYARSTRGIDLYCYGELLDSPGGPLSVSSYTKYMSVTDNTWSNYIRNDVVGSGNAGAYSHSYHKNASASQLVLWAESHDNYTGDGSRNMSTQSINKTWALVAARADAMSLYLARPENTYPQKLGVASVTGWSYKEVGAVNHFHNAFIGQSEYVANQNGIAYVERGNSGVVLVNCGGNSASVNVTANMMKSGTYVDQITGNTFTVSGGRIRGNIGSTGIAVVYNADSCGHPSHNTDGICSSCYAEVGHSYNSSGRCACGAAQRVIYFTNSGNWSSVYLYAWYTDSDVITASWPGSKMTRVEGKLYCYTLPDDTPNVIFTNGSSQTKDLSVPDLSSGKNLYDYSSGKWSVYTAEPDPDPVPETRPTTPPETKPTAPPETRPVTQPETQPVTGPTVTRPTTGETEPYATTEPAATLDTQPVTQPVAQPETEPTAAPATQPTTEPNGDTETAPGQEPDTPSETRPDTTDDTRNDPDPTDTAPTQPADPTKPEGSSAWIIWVAGGILLLTAAAAATVFALKHKN